MERSHRSGLGAHRSAALFVRAFLWVGGLMGGLVGLIVSSGPMPAWQMDIRDKFSRVGFTEALSLVDFGMQFALIALYTVCGLLAGWMIGSLLASVLMTVRSVRRH